MNFGVVFKLVTIMRGLSLGSAAGMQGNIGLDDHAPFVLPAARGVPAFAEAGDEVLIRLVIKAQKSGHRYEHARRTGTTLLRGASDDALSLYRSFDARLRPMSCGV